MARLALHLPHPTSDHCPLSRGQQQHPMRYTVGGGLARGFSKCLGQWRCKHG
jgi:hypothetical protein